jgi:hypothetical protein
MKIHFLFVSAILLAFSLVACNNNEPSSKVEGALAGKFSVSASKRVCFSSGNLQYQPSSGSWRFAPNQWDCVGVDNQHISSYYYAGWLDLFGWGTGNNPTNFSTEYRDYSVFVDWGKNMGSGWRTLSYEEWSYLFFSRGNANNLRGKATVNGVPGYVFLPDKWLGGGFIPNSLNAETNSYTISQWQQLEQLGAVFLPAAGYRVGSQNIERVAMDGSYYSSSSAYETSAFSFNFPVDAQDYWNDADISYWGDISYGMSVRLVKDL